MIEKFVKNSDHPELPSVRKSYGIVASIVGLIVNLLLAAAKIGVGLLMNVLSITADGINNLSDGASAMISLFSFYVTSKPADKEHPFGHARAEYMFSSLVALIIFYIGIQIGRQSIQKIQSPESLSINLTTFLLLIVSIFAKIFLFRFYRNIGNRIDSDMLHATSVDSLSDVISTAAVLLSIALFYFFEWNLDGWMGLFVSVLIIKAGVGILLSTMNRLLGTGPSEKDVKTIDDFINAYDGILGVHDLIVHDYGPGHKFITAHAEVDAKNDIVMTHETIDHIEQDAEEKLGVHLTIHMDPIVIDDPQTNKIKMRVETLVKEINPNYAVHDLRIGGSGHALALNFDVIVPIEDKQSDLNIQEQVERQVTRAFPSYQLKVIVSRDRSEQTQSIASSTVVAAKKERKKR